MTQQQILLAVTAIVFCVAFIGIRRFKRYEERCEQERIERFLNTYFINHPEAREELETAFQKYFP